jgi:hypothetical protein
MLFMVLALIATPAPAEDTLFQAIVAQGCYANASPDPAVVRELLAIERAAGITGEGRGLLVAAACNESGFKAKARGDWSEYKETGVRVPTSLGMVQMKGWWVKRHPEWWTEAKTKEPRYEWRLAARVWSNHIVRQLPRVRRECGYTSERDVWRAAHRTALRPAKCARWRVSKRTGNQYCAKRIARCHRLDTARRLKGMSPHWRIREAWLGRLVTKYVKPAKRKARAAVTLTGTTEHPYAVIR